MILVDTSIWVDHLRRSNAVLTDLLGTRRVLSHPFVVGELSLGGVARAFLDGLRRLPQAPIASHDEVFGFIQNQQLAGRGIGYVDVHLLAATRLIGDAKVWTLDKRLRSVADTMSICATVAH